MRRNVSLPIIVLLVAVGMVDRCDAQSSTPSQPIVRLGFAAAESSNRAEPIPVVEHEESGTASGGIQQAQCRSCTSPRSSSSSYRGAGCVGHDVAPLPGSGCGPSYGCCTDSLFRSCACGSGPCIPGREQECYGGCDPDAPAFHRFLGCLYSCMCCPDPCYEPKWLPIADSAFFVEAPRPVSHTKIRWDAGIGLILPDRSEYFWAKQGGGAVAGAIPGKGPTPNPPAIAVPRLDYHELRLYNEAATGLVGVIVDIPYRSLDPDFADHAAGFGDIRIGLKTLIFDCELIQVATVMNTYIPAGSAGKGLGVGHVSLEPTLLFAIKLHEESYLQGQIAQWIPIGGDLDYAGAILHYHFAVNHTLVRILPNVPLIGTLEMSGYSFQDGAFTDPVLGPFQESSDSSYFYAGAGLRMHVCDTIDFGFAFHAPLTQEHFAEQWYRTEFRFRF